MFYIVFNCNICYSDIKIASDKMTALEEKVWTSEEEMGGSSSEEELFELYE